MTTPEEWLNTVRELADSYKALNEAADLADRLHILGETQGLRRMAEHLRHYDVPEDQWASLLALHPRARDIDIDVTIIVLLKKMQEGRQYDGVGVAERIVDRHAPNMAWVQSLGKWLIWDGRRWKADHVAARTLSKDTATRLLIDVKDAENAANALAESDDKEARTAAVKRAKALRQFVAASREQRPIDARLSLAQTEGLAVEADAFDTRTDLLTVGNGTLELGPTAAFREHRRMDRTTCITAVNYVPEAVSARWNAFLEHAIPDPEVRTYLQKLIGYSLWGANDRRLLVILIGKGGTAKSTLVEVISAVLGDHASDFKLSLFAGKQTDAPRPDLIAALPKRFLHASETSSRWKLHADEIKTLTGDDTQRARGMASDTFLSRKAAFLPFLATNAAPTIEGADQPLWDRLVAIPFDQVVAKDERRYGLASELAREDGEAILAWAVEGWNLLQAEGLDMPNAVVQASMALRDSLSILDTWLAEETEKDTEYVTSTTDLWEAYSSWCVTGGVSDQDRGNKIAFGMNLGHRGYDTAWLGPKDKRQRARGGIRLKGSRGNILN